MFYILYHRSYHKQRAKKKQETLILDTVEVLKQGLVM